MWNAGVLCWNDFVRAGRARLSAAAADRILREIAEAEKALEAGWLNYFMHRLPALHRIRVLAAAGGAEGCLDVETDGLSPTAEITTVALATAQGVRVFVRGVDLPDFLLALKGCALLLTFNGERFDVPFLTRHFRMALPVPHLDLLPVLRAMGWRGGLKECEQRVGIRRAPDAPRNGAEAVELWRRWSAQDDSLALQQLVHYNAQDACSLQSLARAAYRRSMAAYPLKTDLPFSMSCSLTTKNLQSVG